MPALAGGAAAGAPGGEEGGSARRKAPESTAMSLRPLLLSLVLLAPAALAEATTTHETEREAEATRRGNEVADEALRQGREVEEVLAAEREARIEDKAPRRAGGGKGKPPRLNKDEDDVKEAPKNPYRFTETRLSTTEPPRNVSDARIAREAEKLVMKPLLVAEMQVSVAEDRKWAETGKDDLACGYAHDGSRELKPASKAYELRQSYGCLSPFRDAVADIKAVQALKQSRSFGGDIILLLAHWADDYDKQPPPRYVVEDLVAQLENLRMLHIDHFVVSVVEQHACEYLENAIREIDDHLLPPGHALSCAWVPNDYALPATDMAGEYVHLCYLNDVQEVCAKAKRYMLARMLRNVDLRVLFLNDDVTIAVNPYPFLDSAVVAKRDVAIVLKETALEDDAESLGAFVIGGCRGGAGDVVLHELRSALMRFLRPNSAMDSYEKEHPLYEDLGPTLHARTNLEPTNLFVDLAQAALSGHKALCRAQSERHMHGEDEGGKEAKHAWKTRMQNCEAKNARKNSTAYPASPEEVAEAATTMRNKLERGARAGFGWRGSLMGPPAVAALARDAGKHTVKAKLGECEAAEDEDGALPRSGNTILLGPSSFLAPAGSNTAALALQWGELDNLPHGLCARRLAAKVAGFRGPRTYVPGASVYSETKYLALRGDWSRAQRRSSFQEYLMDVRKMIAMAAVLERTVVLPRVPCEGFTGDRVRDGGGADLARLGEDKMYDYGAVEGADPKLRTGEPCKRHGLAPRAHWPVGFAQPEMDSIPAGDKEDLRHPIVVGCDNPNVTERWSSMHSTLDVSESKSMEGFTTCELVTECLCHQGSEAVVTYEADLQARIANENGRFGKDRNLTSEVVALDTKHLSLANLYRELGERRNQVGLLSDGSDPMPSLKDVDILYLEPRSFNHGGAATNLPELWDADELLSETGRLRMVYSHMCPSLSLELQWYGVQCDDGNADRCKKMGAKDVFDRMVGKQEGKDAILGNRPRMEHSVGLIARGLSVGQVERVGGA